MSARAQVLSGERCARIVSLAPSVTETLFDMGLGDRVVGVTKFCRYPAAATALPTVGGLYDINLERVVAQKPTHVFMLKENAVTARALDALNISSSVLDHAHVAGIKESYDRIAKVCGVESVAEQKLAAFALREGEIQLRCQRASPLPPRRTMVVVGRMREGNVSSGIYISGRDGFYSDVLQLVGAENVNSQQTVAVPSVSAEGIIKLAPDVILEIVNQDDQRNSDSFVAFWQKFSKIPAVRSNKIFIIDDDFASIPGPRYILLASKLSSILCPP